MVISMLSDNVQYLLKEAVKVLLKSGKDADLLKGVYMDKQLDKLIGFKKVGISHCEYDLRVNKLEHVMEMTINLDELDNTDNLKDGRPSDALFTYYLPVVKDFIHFEPHSTIPNLDSDDVIVPGMANLSVNIELSSTADPKGTLMSNIGRAIEKKLAVKLVGNEILSVDDFNIFAMLPRPVEDKVRKKGCNKARHHL